MRLVLASASPRRAELLTAAGFAFDVMAVTVDERPLEGESPEAYVLRLADAKAAEAGSRIPGSTVIAADTAVVIDGRILGKPTDWIDAAAMLEMLTGRAHDVLTGVAIHHLDRRARAIEQTRVYFLQLSPREVEWYLAGEEWQDKAGAYGVQGLASRFISRIEGSYSNVVGLPVARVYQLLQQVGALEVAAD